MIPSSVNRCPPISCVLGESPSVFSNKQRLSNASCIQLHRKSEMTIVGNGVGGPLKILLAIGIASTAITSSAAVLPRLDNGERLTISAIGTSETASSTWLNELGAWLNSQYPGKVTLNNEAISGTNSTSGINVQLPAALKHNPDVVFIEFAMNDTGAMTVEQSKANLQTMINTIKQWAADQDKAVDIIIQTMNNEPWSGYRPELPAYYQGYREVAAANRLLLIDHYPNWLNLFNSEPDHATWKSYMDSIGVHPNALGVEKIILPEIQRALKSQVPEPSTRSSTVIGLLGLSFCAWVKRRKKSSIQHSAIAVGIALLTTIASLVTTVNGQDIENTTPTSPQAPRVEKAVTAFRFGPGQWMPDDRWRELLAMFEKYKGVTDELALFTSATGIPSPLETMQQRCPILAKRISEARALGYRVGIDVTATLGHLEEHVSYAIKGDYRGMVDSSGRVAQGMYCPNDPGIHAYISALYKMLAETDPDFIWSDDDLRMASHGVQTPCFCEGCLEIFAKECGKKYTREELWHALNVGSEEERVALRNLATEPAKERMAIRKAWLVHNVATINRVLAVIERAVHEVKPEMPIGCMTHLRFYCGNGFAEYAKTVGGPNATPVYWRPGAGFYNDFTPLHLFRKSHTLGQQVSLLPPSVVTIESEVENYPYQRVMKSCNMTAVEAASHIAAGCTGTAFAVLPFNSEPIAEYEPMFERLHQVRPFLDRMAKTFGRTPPVGVWSAWKKDAALVADVLHGDWFGRTAWPWGRDDSEVIEVGVPAAYSQDNAKVTLLNRQSVSMFSKEELTRILSSGVYMDVDAMAGLNEKGLQELIGMDVGQAFHTDCVEENVAHPLNGPFARRCRDVHQSMWSEPAYQLKLVDPKAQTITRLVDFTGVEKAAASMAVFENRLGGRICVSSYYPWTWLATENKMTQMRSVLRWLSRDQLPAFVESYHRAVLWARPLEDGRLAIALFNASYDPANKLTLLLRTQSATINVVDMAMNEQTIQTSGDDGPYRRFVLSPIEPWNVRLVVTNQ